MKPAFFLGDSRVVIRDFPADACQDAGYQIGLVQEGKEPLNWKPLPIVGPGAREIRVRDPSGAYRVIYTANFPEAVYVLHAFQKKTPATPKRELDLAARRLALLNRQRS